MAPKRPIENPPPASDSEEDVSASEDNVEDHDDEQEAVDGEDLEESDDGEETEDDEEEKYTVKKASTVALERSDSEEETNSDQPSPSPTSFNVKPISSRPMDSEPNESKQKSKPKSGKKVDESPKKKKTVIGGGDNKDDVKKGSAVQRLWSEDDVIVILEGMINYKATKGSDPYADMGAFHEFIKKSLRVSVQRNQLVKKLWSLKNKYLNNVKKGEDPVFSNPYEVKSFKLSKKIWGVEGSNDNTSTEVQSVKSKQRQSGSAGDDSERVKKKVKVDEVSGDEEELSSLGEKDDAVNGRVNRTLKIEVSGDEEEEFSSLALERERFDWGSGINKGMLFDVDKIGSVKAMELNEKWKQLHIDELELFVQRTELINENAVAVLEALKKSSHP